jgi:hypothetical protein
MTRLVNTRTLWVRLCALAAFSCALLVGRGAFAAAPMCGEHAESIAAPPIGTPTSTASLHAERPCSALTLMLDQSAPDRQAPQKVTIEPAPDRVLPVLSAFVACPVLARLPAPSAETLPAPQRRLPSVYRPPRA